jgi:outer membrane protein OmpA-like peptidoglycan-associated protein
LLPLNYPVSDKEDSSVKKIISILSILAFVMVGCATKEKNTENEKTTKGAGIGAATGGILGGIIGKRSGDTHKGAVLGAAAGAAIGGLIGHRMDQQAKELNKVAETKRTEEGLVTKLKGDILFDTDKATLKPEARENLIKIANIMKDYPENVLTIKGYTDNTGPSEYNDELSEKRAEAVERLLVTQGLPGNTIKVVGLGEANPVADNSTTQGRQKNRRVDIDVTVDPSKVPKEN